MLKYLRGRHIPGGHLRERGYVVAADDDDDDDDDDDKDNDDNDDDNDVCSNLLPTR